MIIRPSKLLDAATKNVFLHDALSAQIRNQYLQEMKDNYRKDAYNRTGKYPSREEVFLYVQRNKDRIEQETLDLIASVVQKDIRYSDFLSLFTRYSIGSVFYVIMATLPIYVIVAYIRQPDTVPESHLSAAILNIIVLFVLIVASVIDEISHRWR